MGLPLVGMIVLLVLCCEIMDLHPSGRAAAAQIAMTSHRFLKLRKRR